MNTKNMNETDLAAIKTEARKAAFERRKEAHSEAASTKAIENLLPIINEHKGKVISGYMPIRTEVSPLPVMAALSAHGPICVPVIMGARQAMKFALWDPGTKMVDGAFGAVVPEKMEFVDPEVLIMPLVAFDRNGGRLGYGGGFYDRSLEGLRAKQPTLAIGYAYSAQECENLPLEATDQPLDAIVTEKEVIWF